LAMTCPSVSRARDYSPKDVSEQASPTSARIFLLPGNNLTS
jgi:hypothetical protein